MSGYPISRKKYRLVPGIFRRQIIPNNKISIVKLTKSRIPARKFRKLRKIPRWKVGLVEYFSPWTTPLRDFGIFRKKPRSASFLYIRDFLKFSNPNPDSLILEFCSRDSFRHFKIPIPISGILGFLGLCNLDLFGNFHSRSRDFRDFSIQLKIENSGIPKPTPLYEFFLKFRYTCKRKGWRPAIVGRIGYCNE